jgi:hypothetical protein
LNKILNPVKKKAIKTKKIVEKRVGKGIRTVRKTVKDTGRDIRKRTGI